MDERQVLGVRYQLGMSQKEMASLIQISPRKLALYEGHEWIVQCGFSDQPTPMWMPFAMGWLLMNGGYYVPWNADQTIEQLERLKSDLDLHWEEFACLFGCQLRTMRRWQDKTINPPHRRIGLIICWIRFFGARDIFSIQHLGACMSLIPTAPAGWGVKGIPADSGFGNYVSQEYPLSSEMAE